MSSGFITEAELAEVKKRRQEQWEQVRKPNDPIERPEEPIDNRSLFDRLQEQKQKKDLEYEEAHKLKNMIKGLDDDEIEFLDLVDRTKLAADRKKELEEEKELNDYRNRVAVLQEKFITERLQAEIVVNKPKANAQKLSSQQKLLKGVVVKKTESRKRKMSDSNESETNKQEGKQEKLENEVDERGDNSKSENILMENIQQGAFKCVAILPGLGCYENSSSSTDENSSDSEPEKSPSKTDLVGRCITVVKKVERKS